MLDPGKAKRPSQHPQHSIQKAMELGSTCRITIRGYLRGGPVARHPTSARLLGRIKPFFPHFSFRHRVWWPGVGVKQEDRMPKGHVVLGSLFNIFLTEFPPVISRTQPRCKNQAQTLTRWPCFSPARSFKWWGTLTPELEYALSPHGWTQARAPVVFHYLPSKRRAQVACTHPTLRSSPEPPRQAKGQMDSRELGFHSWPTK